jgi:hypothetical protein
MKWADHRNLRLRPSKPALGRGRLQVQVRRAFITADAPALSVSEIYDWCYARRRLLLGKPLTTRHRYSVWRILVTIADPIERVPPHGAWLWRCVTAWVLKLPPCFPAIARNKIREQYQC